MSTTKLPHEEEAWDREDGYHTYLYDTYAHAGVLEYSESNLDPLMVKHVLLEFLDYLKILEYSKYYEHVYQIRIKVRDEQ